MNDQSVKSGERLSAETERESKEPVLYKVLLLNDDYTTMEFVVSVLENVFNKGPAEATQIMLHVHRKGIGLCGVYVKEIAETKVHLVHALARDKQFPLKCITEKE